MIWPFPGNTNITTQWDDPRPVSNPGEHPHAAIDIGLKVGSQILAPERGKLYLYCAIRHKDGVYWPANEMIHFPYRNYFYDMYGAILVLKGDSGLTHLFAHSYMKQLHNNSTHDWAYIEQKADLRFPIFCMLAGEIEVFAGATIGRTGNAGYSSGPHCHYEQHEGFIWQDWKDRPDPEKVDWEEFK